MKSYRINITVSESVDWDEEGRDLYVASYVSKKESSVRIAKNIFAILCDAYYDGWEDSKNDTEYERNRILEKFTRRG